MHVRVWKNIKRLRDPIKKMFELITNLQCEKPVLKLNFFRQEICSNGRFVLITELTVHISKYWV